MSARRRFAQWLRKWADRIDDTSGPRRFEPHSFTIEAGRGLVIRTDGSGCPLRYLKEDYGRAHDEADTHHAVVNWQNVKDGRDPRVTYRGGRR